MGYLNREIEYKFEVTGATSFKAVETLLDTFLEEKYERKLFGKSTDVYWKVPHEDTADFVRLRFLPETNAGEFTLKFSDTQSIQDRVEIDIGIEEPKNMNKLLRRLLGKPAGEIRKKYSVYFLDNEDTTISLYKVETDPRLFVEIESRDKPTVEKLAKRLKDYSNYELKLLDKSLFELFIKGA